MVSACGFLQGSLPPRTIGDASHRDPARTEGRLFTVLRRSLPSTISLREYSLRSQFPQINRFASDFRTPISSLFRSSGTSSFSFLISMTSPFSLRPAVMPVPLSNPAASASPIVCPTSSPDSYRQNSHQLRARTSPPPPSLGYTSLSFDPSRTYAPCYRLQIG